MSDPANLDEVLNVEDALLDRLQARGDAARLCVDGVSTILATNGYQATIDFVTTHLHNLRARGVFSLDTYTSGVLEPRLMATITQHYDLVLGLRFAAIHGAPLRLARSRSIAMVRWRVRSRFSRWTRAGASSRITRRCRGSADDRCRHSDCARPAHRTQLRVQREPVLPRPGRRGARGGGGAGCRRHPA